MLPGSLPGSSGSGGGGSSSGGNPGVTADAGPAKCSTPNVALYGSDPSWTCVQQACPSAVAGCAGDCTCNDAVSSALACDADGGTPTACFSSALTPVAADSTVTTLVSCLVSMGNQCASPDAGAREASTCMPQTCAQQGYTCGKNADGCQGIIDCGTCVSPQYCGGGGFSRCGP